MEEVIVSDVELCNLAYRGQLEELRSRVLADRTVACRTDQDDRSALHWACSAGHTDVAEYLLRLGVPVDAKDDIALMLLENGASPDATDNLHSTPLHRAASKGNLQIIQILLKHRASTNIQDSEGNTALHLACDEERIEEAKFLVQQGASIYIENNEEKTPLQVAHGGLGAVLRRMVEG
ncbi:hypothetical protein FKM82_002561 [Ascaphus truei]